MKTIIKLTVLATVLSFGNVFAQDSRYALAFSNPLRLNPAIMGPNNDFRAILNYRTQWANIDKGYKTYCFSAISPFYISDKKEKLDIGLNVNSDKAGAFSSMDMSLSVGYTIKLSSSHNLSAAVQAGYIQKSLGSLSGLMFDEQYVNGSYNSSNPVTETINSQKSSYADVGFGLLWFYNEEKAKVHAYAGASGYHLSSPNESFTEGTAKLPARVSYIGGIKIIGDNKIDFTPNIRVTQQKGSTEMAAGVYMDYRFNTNAKLIFGTWYRSHDAAAFSVGLEHKSFTFAYSYDVVTDLNNYIQNSNASEITLSYKFNMAEKKGVNAGPFSLPSF